MSDQTLKFEVKINYPIFLGLSFFVHILALIFFTQLNSPSKKVARNKRSPLIIRVGEKDSLSKKDFFSFPQKPSLAEIPNNKGTKNLNLSDLSAGSSTSLTPVKNRPGTLPAPKTALKKMRYGADEFKKLAEDPMFQGSADLVSTDRVALNFEIPEGVKEDELNESQLKLYGFLRRGAMKYVASLHSEIKDFELKNPHLQFPLVDTKQIMTGRLVFDNQGNLKQIKMVRWSNNDKLQGFFENVLKRLDTLQNPPKELWVESGEFAVFVTLQING